jgi:hypothetical protein
MTNEQASLGQLFSIFITLRSRRKLDRRRLYLCGVGLRPGRASHYC